jgi:hypothetical protein
MSVLDFRPEALADRVDPAEALAALERAKTLTPAQRETLDYALSYWVLQTVERTGDLGGIHLLDRLCAAALRRAGGDDSFAARLKAWRDLLENKRLSIAARRAGGRAAQLRQCQPILDLLHSGTRSQAELAEALALSPGRVSQILAVMESEQLIQRRRHGQQNQVSLPERTAAAAKPAVDLQAAPAQKAGLPRFGQMLIAPDLRVANG